MRCGDFEGWPGGPPRNAHPRRNGSGVGTDAELDRTVHNAPSWPTHGSDCSAIRPPSSARATRRERDLETPLTLAQFPADATPATPYPLAMRSQEPT